MDATTTTKRVIDRFDGTEHAFLSNFFHQAAVPCIDEFGIVYATNEAYYQAHKTNDLAARRAIAEAPTPAKAKRLGGPRGIVLLCPNWEQIKIDVMYAGLKQKFADPELRKLLLATGDAELIEGNTWRDRFWGVYQGQGLNWLGKLLMKLREEIRESERMGAAGCCGGH